MSFSKPVGLSLDTLRCIDRPSLQQRNACAPLPASLRRGGVLNQCSTTFRTTPTICSCSGLAQMLRACDRICKLTSQNTCMKTVSRKGDDGWQAAWVSKRNSDRRMAA
ncbi:uncharacterized protein SPSK_02062 [Sporothrix schenckii 1099-18]|uniref:Uncharacterized protein n=1 Tax=Sporothrix schenckii 1099-18 TaxID=1397361 RepID=A0A0F2MDC6_SPOSC|nr:uncharacterized protein SPSK_02062 [Sporothrix schenckii 1099-18]KJR87079.1 hypothetical protein SPSK_02062 [Sporothrix schenckii 1099-18]